jgi:hypothetical protein
MNVLDMTMDPLITVEILKKAQTQGLILTQTKNGHSALHNVCYLSQPDLIEFLIDEGVSPNQKNSFSITPIMSLFNSPFFNIESLKMLIKKGAKLDFKDVDGESILEWSRKNFILSTEEFDEVIRDLSNTTEVDHSNFISRHANNIIEIKLNELESIIEKTYGLKKELSNIDNETPLLETMRIIAVFNNILKNMKELMQLVKNHKMSEEVNTMFGESSIITSFLDRDNMINKSPFKVLALRAWEPTDIDEIREFSNSNPMKCIKIIDKWFRLNKQGWYLTLLESLKIALQNQNKLYIASRNNSKPIIRGHVFELLDNMIWTMKILDQEATKHNIKGPLQTHTIYQLI